MTTLLRLLPPKERHTAFHSKAHRKICVQQLLWLANLDIPADVTELGEAALSYTALSEFEFPEGVNSVEPYVLSGTDITNIVIPDRFTEIGDYAFLNCKQLKNITLSKNLTDIGTRAFAYTALTQVDLPDGLETLGIRHFTIVTN